MPGEKTKTLMSIEAQHFCRRAAWSLIERYCGFLKDGVNFIPETWKDSRSMSGLEPNFAMGALLGCPNARNTIGLLKFPGKTDSGQKSVESIQGKYVKGANSTYNAA